MTLYHITAGEVTLSNNLARIVLHTNHALRDGSYFRPEEAEQVFALREKARTNFEGNIPPPNQTPPTPPPPIAAGIKEELTLESIEPEKPKAARRKATPKKAATRTKAKSVSTKRPPKKEE